MRNLAIRRLRADGFGVIECARTRSRSAEASLRVSHGGVAVVAAVDIGTQPSTFECVAVRISSGLSTCLVVVICRTDRVTANFFVELSDILDYLSTSGDLSYLLHRPPPVYTSGHSMLLRFR